MTITVELPGGLFLFPAPVNHSAIYLNNMAFDIIYKIMVKTGC